jgi:hypothetical protein
LLNATQKYFFDFFKSKTFNDVLKVNHGIENDATKTDKYQNSRSNTHPN